jgi:hypothetical protein
MQNILRHGQLCRLACLRVWTCWYLLLTVIIDAQRHTRSLLFVSSSKVDQITTIIMHTYLLLYDSIILAF